MSPPGLRAHSGPPLGWGGRTESLPQERERGVRCQKCGAIADCQTFARRGHEWIGRCGIPIMPRHGKKLVHRGCGGSLTFFDIGDFR